MSHQPDKIEIISGPTFQYIPTIDKSAYQRIDLVQGVTTVEDGKEHLMMYHRYSWDDAASGTFDQILFTIPFGLQHVSGV